MVGLTRAARSGGFDECVSVAVHARRARPALGRLDEAGLVGERRVGTLDGVVRGGGAEITHGAQLLVGADRVEGAVVALETRSAHRPQTCAE